MFVNVALCFLLVVWCFARPVQAEDSVKILAFGDSLTAGFGLRQNDAFPAQLEQALRGKGFAVSVINGGVSGDTTAGGLARLNWTLEGNEDLIIVELGANDGLRGIDPAETYKNLDQLLARLKKRNISILLTGMLAPPNLGTEYGEKFNAIYPRLATEHNVDLYPFFLEGVVSVPDLNQDDGIHPTQQGVAKIVENILPFVERLLVPAESSPEPPK